MLKYIVYQSDGLWQALDVPRWLAELRIPNQSEVALRSACVSEFMNDLVCEIQQGNIRLRDGFGRATGKTYTIEDVNSAYQAAKMMGADGYLSGDNLDDNDVAAFAARCGVEIVFSEEEPPVEEEIATPTPVPAAESKSKGCSKQRIASAFDGLHFDEQEWIKYLGDTSSAGWLKECRRYPAKQGKTDKDAWNPVWIGLALMDHPRKIKIEQIDRVFRGSLRDWNEEWREKTKDHR